MNTYEVWAPGAHQVAWTIQADLFKVESGGTLVFYRAHLGHDEPVEAFTHTRWFRVARIDEKP